MDGKSIILKWHFFAEATTIKKINDLDTKFRTVYHPTTRVEELIKLWSNTPFKEAFSGDQSQSEKTPRDEKLESQLSNPSTGKSAELKKKNKQI